MRRDKWAPTPRSVLCSDHFEEACFNRTGQTTRLMDDAVPTIFQFPKHLQESKLTKSSTQGGNLVKERETQVMASRPKRTIKVKRRDDEIYTSEPKRRRRAGSKVTRKEANSENSEVPHKKQSRYKELIDTKLTDENAAIYKRIQESIKVESFEEHFDHQEEIDSLPRKRIPKPSFKIRVKEERFSDEEEDIMFDNAKKSEYVPEESLKKTETYTKKESEAKANKIRLTKKLAFSLEDKRSESGDSTQNGDKVEEMTVSTDKPQSVGKDKIIHLPNNRTYFEFAEPKKKVILQIKPAAEPHELNTQTLEELVSSLASKNLIYGDAQDLLEAFRELPESLIRVTSKYFKKLAKAFDDEAKKFAAVLYFYSRKAYYLINTVFHLPEKSQLQERIQTRNYWPGFTQEALKTLKNKQSKDPAEQICSIMFDIFPIKKELYFHTSEGRWIGHVDFGGGPDPNDSDGIPLASEILLFTAVGIACDWKLPFGYFLNDDLSGEALHNIVNEAIVLLEDCGLKVKAIVCDGIPKNIRMGVLFGCNIHTKSFTELVTNFPHPLDNQRKIHLVFGIKLALSLLRNLLAERGHLRSSTYGIIKWKYFERLRAKKQNTRLKARALVDPDYMKFHHLQRILGQCYPSFSCIENQAFEVACDLQLKDYEGSAASTNFVADMYRAFDLLNSRNPVTTGEKPPITNPFQAEQLESMTVIGQRVFGLEFLSGKRIVSDGRWMSVMLFAFALKSVSILASELLNENKVMYITTYRFNFDHSDMILSCIQRCGSWDGVPTAAEFQKGYKSFMESCTKTSKISIYCNDFDGNDLTVGQGVICPFRKRLRVQHWEDDGFVQQFHHVVELSTDILVKGRCIIRHIGKRLVCAECMALMLDDDSFGDKRNNNVALDYIRPSRFVTDILKISEKVFRLKLIQCSQLKVEDTVVHIFNEYFTHYEKIHCLKSDHLTEEPHHILSLIKVIIRTFVSYRLDATKYLTDMRLRLSKDF